MLEDIKDYEALRARRQGFHWVQHSQCWVINDFIENEEKKDKVLDEVSDDEAIKSQVVKDGTEQNSDIGLDLK